MLVAYLFTVAGFPARGSSKKMASQPFPCQEHDCGCSSALECWTNCCCFSPAEHLAWAREHAVEPPAYALLPTGSGASTRHAEHECVHCEDHHSGKQAHCHAAAQPDQLPETSGCCHKQPPGAQQALEGDGTGIRWVISIKALSCRGLSTLWVASGSVVPPPPNLNWMPRWQVAGQVLVYDSNPRLRCTPPLDPPPRLVKSL
jgi:hypothetical protein